MNHDNDDMSDEDRVREHLDWCELEERRISDACARVIGSWYAVGMGASQQFATTGTITGALWNDLTDRGKAYWGTSGEQRRALDALFAYLEAHNWERGPVEGWSDLHAGVERDEWNDGGDVQS